MHLRCNKVRLTGACECVCVRACVCGCVLACMTVCARPNTLLYVCICWCICAHVRKSNLCVVNMVGRQLCVSDQRGENRPTSVTLTKAPHPVSHSSFLSESVSVFILAVGFTFTLIPFTSELIQHLKVPVKNYLLKTENMIFFQTNNFTGFKQYFGYFALLVTLFS